MFTALLFLGLEVTDPIAQALDAADPAAVSAFIKKDDAYLQDINYNDRRYIGKFAGAQTDLASLELLEENIRSLLAKILEPQILSDTSLHLFPLVDKHARK